MPEAKTIKGITKILVCDDDKAVSSFLERFLKEEGYVQVDIALSQEEALEKISKDRYQLVLLDINLSGIHGIGTLKRIKEIDNKITVIVIADSSHKELARQAVEMGAYDCIFKPFDLAHLKLLVLTKMLIDYQLG